MDMKDGILHKYVYLQTCDMEDELEGGHKPPAGITISKHS